MDIESSFAGEIARDLPLKYEMPPIRLLSVDRAK